MQAAVKLYVEQLNNGAWNVGFSTGGCDDYGTRGVPRNGYATYEEAEKFAVSFVRAEMRKLANTPVPKRK